MNIVFGTLLGLSVTSFVRATLTRYLSHDEFLVAFITGLWTAWPFYHRAWVARKNFLHPPVRRYKVPIKQAFAKVRQVLSNSTYNFGDKWHVSSADTMQRRITACLRFSDEEMRMEGTSASHMHMRKERRPRLLELEVQFEEEPDGTTLIQFDFRPKVEGISLHACDRIIYGLRNDLLTLLGPGEALGDEGSEAIKLSPPWWLIAITILGLISFCGSAIDHLAQGPQRVQDSPKGLQRTGANLGGSISKRDGT